MATIFGVDHKLIMGTYVTVATGVCVYTTYKLLKHRRQNIAACQKNRYESERTVNEYLLCHYGSPRENLNYDSGPRDSTDFQRRCAELCFRHVQDLPEPKLRQQALDVGCAVGRSSFELARWFEQVVGIEYSHAMVDVCNRLKSCGEVAYSIPLEGDLSVPMVASVPADIDRTKLTFRQGDACELDSRLGQFGCVLAANLIDRLHTPRAFLARLADLVLPGGILVITSPYTWTEESTEKKNWLGGFHTRDGKQVTTFSTLQKELEANFTLVEELNMPFLIRETMRKHQWTVSHATVWKRNVL